MEEWAQNKKDVPSLSHLTSCLTSDISSTRFFCCQHQTFTSQQQPQNAVLRRKKKHIHPHLLSSALQQKGKEGEEREEGKEEEGGEKEEGKKIFIKPSAQWFRLNERNTGSKPGNFLVCSLFSSFFFLFFLSFFSYLTHSFFCVFILFFRQNPFSIMVFGTFYFPPILLLKRSLFPSFPPPSQLLTTPSSL